MNPAFRLRPLAFVLLLSAVVFSGYYWWRLSLRHDQLRNDTLAQAAGRATQLAEAQGDEIEALLLGIDLALRQFRDAWQSGNKTTAEAVVRTTLDTFPENSLLHFSTIAADGYIDYSTLGVTERIYIGDRDYFKFHLDSTEDRLYINKPIFGRTNGRWMTLLTRPIFKNQRFAGVAVVSLSPEYLARRLAELEMGADDVITLLFTDGTYLARSHNLQEVLGKSISKDRPLLAPDATSKGSFRAAGTADQVMRIFAWSRLKKHSLVVSVGLDERAILAPVEREIAIVRRNNAIGIAVLLLLVTSLAALLLRSADQQKLLVQREILLRSTLDSTADGILVVDGDGNVLDANRRFYELWHIPQEVAAANRDEHLLAAVLGQLSDPDTFRRDVMALYQSDIERSDTLSFKDGRIFERYTRTFPHGGRRARLWSFRDVTEQKRIETQLDRVAHYDPLTGIPNRRLLADRLQHAIAHAQRSSKPLAISYLDLDGFKPINDRFGHAAGDRLLVEVATRLQSVLRAEDTLARLGGDEFVLLLTDLDSAEESRAVLERVLATVSAPMQIDGETISISASIGVTLYPRDAADADTLLRHADHAMYQAKESGKNCYHLFVPRATPEADT